MTEAAEIEKAGIEGTDRRPRVRRPVSSFVRRSSRMSPHQRSAWEQRRRQFLVEVPRGELSTSVAPGSPIELALLFGRQAPLIVEIGPGSGDSLVPMAAARPEADVLAFEVYEPAAARLVAALDAQGIDTVRVVQADAVDGLRHLLGADAISELWTFFPDPWPKARHHKRRLIDRPFADLVAARVRPGGIWRLATDWADYAEHMRHVLDAHPAWQNLAAGGSLRWEARPVSRFERRGLDAGRDIVDLAYGRR